jgi:hypothetical protein
MRKHQLPILVSRFAFLLFLTGLGMVSGHAGTITLRSDLTTSAAAVGPGGVPSGSVLSRLDTSDISGLTFSPVVDGGEPDHVPPGAPAGTQDISISPGDAINGANGYFKLTFTLPANFSNAELTGSANVDDFGRVFLNGTAITPSLFSSDSRMVTEFGNAMFSAQNQALFVPGTNVILVSDDNGFGGPSSGEFYMRITFATGLPNETWTATGSLNAVRAFHTATLLTNGKVLVAGGLDSSQTSIASAELYDPATESWTTANNLNTARGGHTATSLPNGKVLVAGGRDVSGNASASAELYDPVSGTWTVTNSLHTGRYLHTAVLLPNGMVLIAGGQSTSSNALASAELYNPANGTWSVTGSLNPARRDHTLTLLQNGKVLVAGGHDNGDFVSAQLYNPANGMWTNTGNLHTARRRHTATLLNNGQVLVAGGSQSGDITLDSAEIYDPANGLWTPTTSLNTTRETHIATLLPNGMVLVAGGELNAPSGVNPPLASAEVYDPAGGTWTVTGSFNTARASHTATLLQDGDVLAAGGTDSNGNGVAIAELYGTSAPVIIGGNLSASATAGQQFVYQISASHKPTSYGASGLPSGLSIDTSSGIIYGVPSVSGNFPVQISATNSFGTGSANLALTVQPAPSGPQIISSTSATGRTGQPFRFQILLSGATSSAQISTGPLPSGLSFDPGSGVISGMPSSDGNFSIILTVIDGLTTTTAALQLTFTSDPAVPIITSSDVASLTPGQSFGRTLTADAGATFSYIGSDGIKHDGPSSAGLPPGLSFDGVNFISGTFTGGSATTSLNAANRIHPDTITIRPRLIGSCQLIATNDNGTSTSPLNFFATTPPPLHFSFDPPDQGPVEAVGPNGVTVDFSIPTATDADGGDVPVHCNAIPGSSFPVGTTLVTCTAIDKFGNTGVASFNVIVQDTALPVITAMPVSITVAKQKVAKGLPQGAIVNFANQLAATDIVDGTFVPSAVPASGSFFPLGTTTVTVTAKDHAGNMSPPKTFTVTVASKAPKGKAATVHVSANPTTINEGQDATFTISLSAANSSQPVSINYTIAGTAVIGTNYSLTDQWGAILGLSGSVTVPSGASSAAVTLHSKANSVSPPSVAATMTIGGGSGYKLSPVKKNKPNLNQTTVTINSVP